jgi:hypothetical protein
VTKAAPRWPDIAYTIFVWQLTKAKLPLIALLSEASRACLHPMPNAGRSNETMSSAESTVAILASAGRMVSEDVAKVVRHNCVGSAFQIVYSLFESYVKSLGCKPGPQIECGRSIKGEKLSRVLWACRNAFAHGDEWKREGFRRPHAKLSYEILSSMGIAQPQDVDLYDIYISLSGGDPNSFFHEVAFAGRELADATPHASVDGSSVGALNSVLIGSTLVTLSYTIRELSKNERLDKPETSGVVAYRYIKDGEQITIPIADGNLRTPIPIAGSIREGAINRLRKESAAPFRRYSQNLEALFADVAGLFEAITVDASHYSDLIDLAQRAEQLYRKFLTLPNPVEVLIDERGVESKEQLTTLLAEILADRGLSPMTFREIATKVED